MTLCGDLLAECWDKLVDLCAEYGIDMTEPDDAPGPFPAAGHGERLPRLLAAHSRRICA